MPRNDLGNYLRERRMDLGLTQEQLAERIGGTASQAEISRLERGSVMLPRRDRMEALAAALDVSLGLLLVHSGWLSDDEQGMVDSPPDIGERLGQDEIMAIVSELNELRDYLLSAIGRVNELEDKLQGIAPPAERNHVPAPAGLFDNWETSTVFND